LIPEHVEVAERIVGGKVLELDEELRKDLGHGFHKFMHKRIHLGSIGPPPANAQVKWVREELVRVRPQIQTNGKGRIRLDTSTSDIQIPWGFNQYQDYT